MMAVSNDADRVSTAVLSIAAIFFAASAWTAVRTAHLSLGAGAKKTEDGERRSKEDAGKPRTKLSSASAVGRMTYATRPDDCESFTSGTNERPKIHAGALFKLIDIAAGVAARRHAELPCVTISVDSVVLLKPIFLGDLIHVSASVNRAWGSSMEVGVRILKETVDGKSPPGIGATEYVSHSYLTFVALQKQPERRSVSSSSSFLPRTLHALTPSMWRAISQEKQSKPALAKIETTSRLEARRHFLAGRRRTKRLEDAKRGKTREGVSVEVKRQVRKEMEAMLAAYEVDQHTPPSRNPGDERRRSEMLRSIEMEVIIQAWAQGDEIVSVHDGTVKVSMPGDEPIAFPEADVRAKAKLLGVKVPGDVRYSPLEYRLHGSATPSWANGGGASSPISTPKKKAIHLSRSTDTLQSTPGPHLLPVAETVTTSMHIVFPQHTNSHGIIFGGNTMAWSEEVAIMACRRLRVASNGRTVSWKTVSMDGLEFNVQVGVGELMILSAIVVRTYVHSCEVYVLAQAEDRQGNRRITNDVLFTLAYDVNDVSDREEANPEDHIATQIIMPSASALESFAAVSTARRQQRLELRQMLIRVYGS